MALFDVSRPGKSSDNIIAKKSNTKARRATPTIKGGDSLISRMNQAKLLVEKNLAKYKDDYELVMDADRLAEYTKHCTENGIVSIDTETEGLNPLQDIMAGFSMYTPNEKAIYVPIHHISYITKQVVPNQIPPEVCKEILEALNTCKTDITMFNATFDIRVIRHWLNLYLTCSWDAFLAARCLNENEPKGESGLKALHAKYVLHGKEDAFSFEGYFKGIPFTQVPLQTGYLYPARDAIITHELRKFQEQFLVNPEREDLQGVANIFFNVEMPIVDVVADMEDVGVALDHSVIEQLSKKYHKLDEDCKAKISKDIEEYSDAISDYKKQNPGVKLDNPINVASPNQLAILLYDIIGCESVDKKSPRGTGEDILKQIDLPICKDILELRGIEKLLSTYIDKMPECADPKDGRVHCNYNQYGADTGRFSSSDPNLQNIPSHNKEIRHMFKATDGYVLLGADYSQQEPKVMAQMCGDEKLQDAIRNGRDVYSSIASIAFNRKYEDCLEFILDENGNKTDKTNAEGKEYRSQAKPIFLGTLYGRGVASIAEQLHKTKEEAQEIQDKVFKGFPAIPKFTKDSIEMAQNFGYVTTLWGRKRRLPDMQLPKYEITYDGMSDDVDPLDFDDTSDIMVPEATIRKYYRLLDRTKFDRKGRSKVLEKAKSENISIVDNSSKIAAATRQCVNSRIQGSAADMSKLAMQMIGKDPILKELGFRMLIPVHDEIIGECPEENMNACAKRFSELMSKAPGERLTIPINCDVVASKNWYGEEIPIDED